MKTFKNLGEIKPYYNQNTSTYEFKENNKYLDIQLDFDLLGEYKIKCNNLIAKEINIKHIECNDLKAESIYNSYGACTISANYIICKKHLYVSNIKANNIISLYIYVKNIFCNNINCKSIEVENKIKCCNINTNSIHGNKIEINNITILNYCIAVEELKTKQITKLSDRAEVFCCKNDIEYIKEC